MLQTNHLHSPSVDAEGSVKLLVPASYTIKDTALIQAQAHVPQNTASRLLLLKEKLVDFEGCPLLFPQAWLPGFREHCKDKKACPPASAA